MLQSECLFKLFSYQSIILLGFLSIAKHAIASPTDLPSTLLHAPAYDFPAYQPSRKYTPPIQSDVTTPHDSPIVARADPYGVLPISSLNPGWELDFHDFDWGYLPISSASTVLQGFYNRVFELATSSPGPMPQYSVIRWGALDLGIMANQGVVAWASVATFAAHMLQTARRGYTNSYHCTMTNIAGGIFISFNLFVSATKVDASASGA